MVYVCHGQRCNLFLFLTLSLTLTLSLIQNVGIGAVGIGTIGKATIRIGTASQLIQVAWRLSG